MLSATRWSAAAPRATSSTRYPRAERWRAASAPTPLDAPVIKAVFIMRLQTATPTGDPADCVGVSVAYALPHGWSRVGAVLGHRGGITAPPSSNFHDRVIGLLPEASGEGARAGYSCSDSATETSSFAVAAPTTVSMTWSSHGVEVGDHDARRDDDVSGRAAKGAPRQGHVSGHGPVLRRLPVDRVVPGRLFRVAHGTRGDREAVEAANVLQRHDVAPLGQPVRRRRAFGRGDPLQPIAGRQAGRQRRGVARCRGDPGQPPPPNRRRRA